jgi:predicted nucleic acid-binding protein
VIALDASVVIAHLASHDVHHAAASRFFREHLDDDFIVHTLNLTEIMVGPVRAGREAAASHGIAMLGIIEWVPPPGAERLARLRVESGLKLPDACVLDAALQTGAALASFDTRLLAAAEAMGVVALRPT